MEKESGGYVLHMRKEKKRKKSLWALDNLFGCGHKFLRVRMIRRFRQTRLPPDAVICRFGKKDVSEHVEPSPPSDPVAREDLC